MNFLLKFRMEEGETQYFSVQYYSYSRTGSFTVRLTELEGNDLKAEAVDEAVKYVNVGDSTSLYVSVDAADTSHVTYQWYKNGSFLTGETDSELELENITAAEEYSCQVYDGYGNTAEVVFRIVLIPDIHVGETAAVQIDEDNGAYLRFIPTESKSYRFFTTGDWYTYGRLYNEERDDWYISSYAAEGDCNFTFFYDVTEGETYYLYVRLDQSSDGLVSVPVSVQIDSGLSVSAEITNVYISAGKPFELAVQASCEEGSLTYRWERVIDEDEEEYQVVGGNSAVYSKEAGTAEDTGMYRVTVTDDYGVSRTIYYWLEVTEIITLKPMGTTYIGLIIPYTVFSFGQAIFILSGYFASLPRELEEAAVMDGCSIWRCFWTIILPLAKPGIATVALFVFNGTWNELLLGLIFISSDAKKTLPVGLTMFVGPYSTNYGPMIAAIMLAIIPVAVIYCMFANQIVGGLTAGSVKG